MFSIFLITRTTFSKSLVVVACTERDGRACAPLPCSSLNRALSIVRSAFEVPVVGNFNNAFENVSGYMSH